MLISVVIPVLNNARQFEFALQSVLRQQGCDIEVIVIDGGSSDGTLEVIKQYSPKIQYWESGKDKGIADAFNRGVRFAKGELIAILNSDDYWSDDTIAQVVSACEQHENIDIYYGDLQFINEGTQESYIKKPKLKRMKYRMNIYHPAMFVSKSAYNKIGAYNPRYQYAMDSNWCHRAIREKLTFCYIPHVLASMRLGGVSDIEFKKSLSEYRDSLLECQLINAFEAGIYYNFFLFMKIVMKNRIIWKLVRAIS